MNHSEGFLEINIGVLSELEKETASEEFLNYQRMVLMMLGLESTHISEGEILRKYGVNTMLELKEIASLEKYMKVESRDGENWYVKLPSEYIVGRNSQMYDIFFTYWLRNMDLMYVDSFLAAQYGFYFEGEMKSYGRFLQLLLRKYENTLLEGRAEIVKTTEEWIAVKMLEIDSEDKQEKIKMKGVIKRSEGDRVTSLNQEQTALLIHYMQQNRMIMKGENLNNKKAGEAFYILTGYSAETLRQSVSVGGISSIKHRKNLAVLESIISKLQVLVKEEINSQRKAEKTLPEGSRRA